MNSNTLAQYDKYTHNLKIQNSYHNHGKIEGMERFVMMADRWLLELFRLTLCSDWIVHKVAGALVIFRHSSVESVLESLLICWVFVGYNILAIS
jgi:hypothetical protein